MTTDFYGLMLEELEEASEHLSLLFDWIYLRAEKDSSSVMNGAVALAKSAVSSQASAYINLMRAEEQHKELTKDAETVARENIACLIAWIDAEMERSHEAYKDSERLAKYYQHRTLRDFLVDKAQGHSKYELGDVDVRLYIQRLIKADIANYNKGKDSIFSKVGVK